MTTRKATRKPRAAKRSPDRKAIRRPATARKINPGLFEATARQAVRDGLHAAFNRTMSAASDYHPNTTITHVVDVYLTAIKDQLGLYIQTYRGGK